jgi:Tfp pilus assembly protein PilO
MISSASPHKKMIIGTLLAGAMVLVALWMLAISPKRAESASVKERVVTEEQRLATAQTQLAAFKQSRAQYGGLLAELKRLDEAVPARGAISDLLRQLQKRANVRNTELRVAALKPAAAAAPGSATTLTPGAAAPKGGLAALPFTFTYTGRYFDLIQVLAAARKSVTVRSGDLKIDGRLVTIEGVAFDREGETSKTIKASVAGTAYIAAAPTPPTPADPAVNAPEGGS